MYMYLHPHHLTISRLLWVPKPITKERPFSQVYYKHGRRVYTLAEAVSEITCSRLGFHAHMHPDIDKSLHPRCEAPSKPTD